jgi:hypothetical protein
VEKDGENNYPHTESGRPIWIFTPIYFEYAGIISLYFAGYTEYQDFDHDAFSIQ